MSDEYVVQTANTILSQLTVPKRVKSVEEVDSDTFVTIYEGLCGESIPDLILPATSEEAQTHNIQCVIDSLALDVLHTSLAHINGQDIVAGRRMSIINLLDIFSGLLEYILDGIAKDDLSDDMRNVSGGDQRKVAKMKSRHICSDTETATSEDNTEALIALGDEKYLQSSPTASPNSKKTRFSVERSSDRRLSKRVIPHAVSQPMASSSMQSIHPSGTESESDIPVDRGTSKVPADFSPEERKVDRNRTFTKPEVPKQKKMSQKLAEEILKTGESTEELIALADNTPAVRPKTYRSTRSSGQRPTLGFDNGRGETKSRTPKRHVSFISDRTGPTTDSCSDHSNDASINNIQSKEDPRALDDKGSPPRPSITERLCDYFTQKESSPDPSNSYVIESQESSAASDTSDYHVNLERTASLYDRVTALRSAASEKLKSLQEGHTLTTGTDATRRPLSDYATSKKKQQEMTKANDEDADKYPEKRHIHYSHPEPVNGGLDSSDNERYGRRSTYKNAVQTNIPGSFSTTTDLLTGKRVPSPKSVHVDGHRRRYKRQGAENLEPTDPIIPHSTLKDLPLDEKSDWDEHLEGVRKEKSVRFSPSKDIKTKSESMFEAVKKTLGEEKWREKLHHKVLARQYKDDLGDMVEAHREQLNEEKAEAYRQDKEFLSNVRRLINVYGDPQPSKRPVVSRPKGYLLPKSKVIKKRPLEPRKSSNAGTEYQSKSLDPDDDSFIPNLMEEFPHLYLAPETIKKMWMDHQKRSGAIKRSLADDKRRTSKATSVIEDAEKRQAILMRIMQKELEHTKRMKQKRDNESAETENKRKSRETRVQSARVKKYYDDYAVHMRSSMLKNKTREEQLFKKLFAEGLKVQKERMHALRGYAKEQREKRAKQQQNDVQALENFYKDQFAMLAESVAQERKNVEIRDTAQAKVLEKMKKELRKKMEQDIQNFQDQLKRDEDDYYFRQLDAEKVVQELNMTRYQTGY